MTPILRIWNTVLLAFTVILMGLTYDMAVRHPRYSVVLAAWLGSAATLMILLFFVPSKK